MNYVIQPKKIIIFIAFLSVVSFSLIPASQAKALSSKNTPNSSSGSSKQDQAGIPVADDDVQSVAVPTVPLQEPVTPQVPVTSAPMPTTPLLLPVLQEPVQTAPAPVVYPVVSAPATTVKKAPQQKVTAVQQQAPKTPIVQPSVVRATAPRVTVARALVLQSVAAPTLLDTSAGVISTANFQSAIQSTTKGTPYISNKIDAKLAQSLLFAGIATITAGTLMYATTVIPFKKQVRRIPVKTL
jgi:hypothetical protein